MKVWIKDWLQDVQQGLLNDTVTNRRNAELSHTAVRLGDFYPPHWLGTIALVLEFVSKLGDLFTEMLGKIRDVLAIDSGRAFVGFDLRKCSKKPLLLEHAVIEAVISSHHLTLPALLSPAQSVAPAILGPSAVPFYPNGQYKTAGFGLLEHGRFDGAVDRIINRDHRTSPRQATLCPGLLLATVSKKLSNELHPFASW